MPVDGSGLVVEALERDRRRRGGADPGAPAPDGRRAHARAARRARGWLREHDAVAIEDDYDAEYRYDRAAVGALQGLDPDRVVYAGSASKTLAPALRLGWMAVPAALLDAVRYEKSISDQTTARIEQHAMATSSAAASSTATCAACGSPTARAATRRSRRVGRELPDATVSGIAAGPARDGHAGARRSRRRRCWRRAPRRRVAISTISDYVEGAFAADPTLLLGYAQLHEAAIPAAVAELAAAVRDAS